MKATLRLALNNPKDIDDKFMIDLTGSFDGVTGEQVMNRAGKLYEIETLINEIPRLRAHLNIESE